MNKRIYSLNLAAYIIYKTGIKPEYGYDQKDGNGIIYCTFPEDKAVGKAILDYKKDSALHSYLNAYMLLRDDIKVVRGLA